MPAKHTSQQFRDAVHSALTNLGDKQNPVSRKKLVGWLNRQGYRCSDRSVRMAKEELIILDGIRIETAGSGGYYIPSVGDKDTCGNRFFRQGLRLLRTAKVLLGMSEEEVKQAVQKELNLGGNNANG